MSFGRRKDRGRTPAADSGSATQASSAPIGDNAFNAQQVPTSEEEASSLLEAESEEQSNPIDVTPPPIAAAEPPPEAPAPEASAPEATPAEATAPEAPEAAPEAAPATSAVDLEALDAEFKEIWRTTDRAGTDAWLDALASREPIELHAAKAEEYRAWVTEKRAAADARRAEEEAAEAEEQAPPEAVEVAEELPPEVVSEDPEEDDAWSLDDLGELVDVAVNAATETASDVAQAFSDWWWGEEEGESEEEAPVAEEPAAPEVDPRLEERERLLESGKKDNLDVALEFAEDTSPAHPFDKVPDSVKGKDRKKEILEGDADELATLMCSEFTIATLVEAGWDLSEEYRDAATGLKVAYPERTNREGKIELYWVEKYDVAGMWEEATAAVLDAQKGLCERVEPGTERAGEFANAGAEAFLVAKKKESFVGREASSEDEFGAGLTAVALGGVEVDPDDRKPGDLQQRLDLDADGKYTGGGHSSTVNEVKGTGVAWVGGEGSPEISGEIGSPAPLAELTPGWYTIPEGSKLRWIVSAGTSPDRVATLKPVEVTLVDSSNGRTNADGERDATGIGKSYKEDSGVLSNGRLPTSEWIAWSADTGAESLGTLEPVAKKSAKKSG